MYGLRIDQIKITTRYYDSNTFYDNYKIKLYLWEYPFGSLFTEAD